MLDFIHFIGQNLRLIVEHGGYFFLFITTILEGVPIIGQFVPGHTIVILSGFLAKLQILSIVKVSLIVIMAAMVGDIIGFYLGKKYGINFLTRFGSLFFIKKEYIEKVTQLVKEHPAKTIILGRFSPITRPLSPFITGASGTSTKMFWLYDFIAVTLWSLFSIGIGYVFGASYHTASIMFGKFILIAIVVGILIVLGYRFINKQFHIFAKYELISLGFNLFGLYLFFKTVQDALTDKIFLLELDLYINNYFILHAREPWLYIMNIITEIISPKVIVTICILAVIYFTYKKKYYHAIITTLSFSGGYIATFIVKNLVERVRPLSSYIVETGYSFPSGHTVMAVIFSALFIYIFAVKIKSLFIREVVITLSVILALLTAFSRVYLGVHWVSDIIAGIGLGLFWTTLVILFAKYGMMMASVLRRKTKS
jgi:undecaprenyl-diphosphatase